MKGGKYCKLDCNIVYSSMWREDSDTRVIWVSLLALKDENGIVRQNIHGIARIIGIPVEKVMEAVERFQQPDPESTTPDFEGRRLEKVDEGYLILNHFKYRETGAIDDKRLGDRIRQSRHRSNPETTPEIEAIWSAYPRKIGKHAAVPKIRAAIDELGFEKLLVKVKEYAAARAGQDDQFTPYPSTWFNQKRYNDDPESWKPVNKTSPKPLTATTNGNF